ncbi:MAG: hypothetical protein JMDDDDMK_01650 [Acidobacteria bacterium]|nr:hypothetical protein [Acidobacteriota bacterium]
MQISIAFFLSLSLGSILAIAPNQSQTRADSGDVTNQINKTITLAPGSNVTVRGINGRVTIETWDSNQAEINITVKASDTAAMERRPILIDNTPNSLIIRTEEDREGRNRGWDRGWVRHEVNLKLPKSINLKVSSVNGVVDAGAITGEVGVSSVNGRVTVAQAGTATNLSSINGRVSLSLLRLGEGGLRVSSINGGIEIGLPSATNAEVDVRSVNGGINSDLPITVVGEMKRGELRGRVGEGGPPITISSVNGGVTLRRN